jgi:hypothetical protein
VEADEGGFAVVDDPTDGGGDGLGVGGDVEGFVAKVKFGDGAAESEGGFGDNGAGALAGDADGAGAGAGFGDGVFGVVGEGDGVEDGGPVVVFVAGFGFVGGGGLVFGFGFGEVCPEVAVGAVRVFDEEVVAPEVGAGVDGAEGGVVLGGAAGGEVFDAELAGGDGDAEPPFARVVVDFGVEVEVAGGWGGHG